MTRQKAATELLQGCPEETLEKHTEIARAILNNETKKKILDMCDDYPDTYCWLDSVIL